MDTRSFALLILVLNLAAFLMVLGMIRRTRANRKARRVEPPNSEHRSRYVMDQETLSRWEAIPLARLHPVNRQEFERVLADARAAGMRALTAAERAFMDRIATAFQPDPGRKRAEPADRGERGVASSMGQGREIPGTS